MNLRKKWFRFEFVLNGLGLAMVALMSFGLPGPARADTVALHGATTVINVLITPLRATVEKSTGHTLEIVGNAPARAGRYDRRQGGCIAEFRASRRSSRRR